MHVRGALQPEQIELHKKLHSKLTYGLKRARTDEEGKKFEEGLKKLKEDKETMLPKFAEDNQLEWLGELVQTHEVIQSDTNEVVSKELNFWQKPKSKLI